MRRMIRVSSVMGRVMDLAVKLATTMMPTATTAMMSKSCARMLATESFTSWMLAENTTAPSPSPGPPMALT